ncbi:MAG: hypothetical protein A3J79_13065 [Elusimicrobia bacterium RIFOXYB2_FULL_62_6]|nr:MAG: hypothetical protein A3J79_13065 [Elusimicrobia bacterium RIFOXYB2_FULL_62_6]
MNFFAVLSDIIDDPQGLIGRTRAGQLGSAGFLGYLLGVFSLFIFLRIFSVVPDGIYSFGSILLLVLGLNFFLAGTMHLFLQMTGAEGDALKLFLLFGFTELFWVVIIPLGFFAKLNYLAPMVACLVCLLIILLARISLVRRLYTISRGKALLALTLPYAAAMSGFFMAFTYAIVYLIWLVK